MVHIKRSNKNHDEFSPPPHISWLVNTKKRILTADGKEVEVLELQHELDEEILSTWAKHFRNHYCPDGDIDFLRGKKSRKDYLNDIKFPSSKTKLGPGIRAGDFGEILVADYLEYILGYWVPRVRWSAKVVRDESPKGSDVIGFHLVNKEKPSSKDYLLVFESKTGFSKGSDHRLQDAINDSAKDQIRIDESLNFIKQKLYERGEKFEALKVERFQSPVDMPYQQGYGATALFSSEIYKNDFIVNADTTKIPYLKDEYRPHPYRDNISLLVIKGVAMMELVNELYRRAADEA